jgi:hypothetical protein
MAFHLVTPPAVRCAASPASMRKPWVIYSASSLFIIAILKKNFPKKEHDYGNWLLLTGLNAVTFDPS